MPLTKIVHFCGPEIYSLLCIVYAICLPLHLIFIRMTCLCNMCREIRHESGILSDVYVWLCVQYKNKNYLVFFVNKLYSINLYLLYCSSRLWSTTSAVLFSGWFIYTSTSSWIWKENIIIILLKHLHAKHGCIENASSFVTKIIRHYELRPAHVCQYTKHVLHQIIIH